MNNNYTILTNDPSMTAWGYVILSTRGRIIVHNCIQTKPDPKKNRIRKGDSTVRRISEINKELLSIIKKHNVRYILSELPHGSQNAQAAVMIGIVTGIIQTISDTLGVGIEWYSEMDSKNFVLGKRSATKQEMIKKINELYKVQWSKYKYHNEAIADALAIHYIASKQSPTLKFLKK